MSLPKNHCLSTASASLTHTTTTLTTFPDHYASLNLDTWATTEEVKTQFRKLRAQYFATDAKKYRQLQTAYAVLVDWEARREYDAVYRVRMGLPPLAHTAATSETRSDASETETMRSSPASSVSPSPRKSTSVKAAVSRIDAQSQDDARSAKEEQRQREEEERQHEEEQRQHEEEQRQLEEEQRQREKEQRQREAEEEEQRGRAADVNWGLKHFKPQYKPLIGSVPYQSYIPIAVKYNPGEGKTMSRRPKYVREIAKMSMP